MSNLPIQIPESDLSEKDLEKIRSFKAEGLPGLAKVTEAEFYRMTEMYMNGSSYWQIANALGMPRSLVMYVSHTHGWFPARQEYLQELQEKMKARVIDSKLASQDFLLLAIQAYQKKIGKKLQKYLATDDPTHAEEINLKEIDKLLKAVDMLQELSGDRKAPAQKSPSIGVNVGEGVTFERTGENKLTVTPNPINNTLSDMLKKFADKRRAEQKKNDKESDIDQEQTKGEEPKND